MVAIDLEELFLFLLGKFDQKEIKESLERAIQIHQAEKKTSSENKEFDSDLRHKIMARKY
ncbi:MAG: hypothetical protein ACTSRZ_17875 [Promethearchaeota archaeon]